MKTLYAVAFEKLVGQEWKSDIVYLHAADTPNAKFLFIQSQSRGVRYHIVAIGPVLGYHVNDEEGKSLSV
jgi:hypothetical protein